jgi:hypothetical protein
MAQLQRGLFEAEAAPGSASKIRIQLMETPRASGDLNDDGADDKVVILNAETGGSGAFTYLAAVLYENGEAKPVASVLLGDRIQLRTIGIDHGIIRVTLLTRRPDEPMTAAPTVEERKSFKLEDGRLREFVVIGATAPRPIRSGAPRSNPEAPIVESVR